MRRGGFIRRPRSPSHSCPEAGRRKAGGPRADSVGTSPRPPPKRGAPADFRSRSGGHRGARCRFSAGSSRRVSRPIENDYQQLFLSMGGPLPYLRSFRHLLGKKLTLAFITRVSPPSRARGSPGDRETAITKPALATPASRGGRSSPVRPDFCRSFSRKAPGYSLGLWKTLKRSLCAPPRVDLR